MMSDEVRPASGKDQPESMSKEEKKQSLNLAFEHLEGTGLKQKNTLQGRMPFGAYPTGRQRGERGVGVRGKTIHCDQRRLKSKSVRNTDGRLEK